MLSSTSFSSTQEPSLALFAFSSSFFAFDIQFLGQPRLGIQMHLLHLLRRSRPRRLQRKRDGEFEDHRFTVMNAALPMCHNPKLWPLNVFSPGSSIRMLVLQLSRCTRLIGLQIKRHREFNDRLCFCKHGFACRALERRVGLSKV